LTKKTKKLSRDTAKIYDALENYLIPDETSGIKHKAILTFPKEECIKIKTNNECIRYNKVCNIIYNTCSHKSREEYNGLIKIIDKINADTDTNSNDITTITFQLSEFIRKAFTDNDNKIINDMNWSDFVTNASNCGYNYFRKLVVDISIVFIILKLFRDTSIILKKGDTELYPRIGGSDSDAITIVYEMVGSEDTTSDYDVSIYSYPPSTEISSISSIFNWAFQSALENTPDIVFDTNLYTHPIYLFKNNIDNIETDLFIPLNKNQPKYILNSGNEAFYENELLYSNLLYYEGKHHDNLKRYLDFKRTFVDGGYVDYQWSPRYHNYAEMVIYSKNLNVAIRQNTSNQKNISKLDNCVSDQHKKEHPKVGDSNCKTNRNEVIAKRLEYDEKPIKFLTNFYNNVGSVMDIDNIKKNYISPMRVSLWYADETYHTYSAYFHVIHCCAMNTHHESKTAIEWLLADTNHTAFKNICRVSMLENYAFMFHYLNKPIKKIAKYLARISHAAAILNNNNMPTVADLTGTTNNYGNYDYIIKTYKRGNKNAIYNSDNPGILHNLKIITDTNNIQFLKTIYNEMIQSPSYGITKHMFCFLKFKQLIN